MERALVTQRNLEEAMRQQIGGGGLVEVSRAILERDGKLTIIKGSAPQKR